MRPVTESRWTNARGESFRLLGWPSAEPTRTVMLVHHGLHEHAGRYETYARHLAEVPVHLWSYDARGHGRSCGRPGHAAGLEQLADDLDQLIPVVLERSGAERLLLLGHSMGGAVVGHYATTREVHPSVAALLLSAPPVRVARTPTVRAKIALGRALVRLAPRLTLKGEVRPHGISSVAEEVARYVADPLMHDRLSVQLGLSLVDDAPRIIENASRIRLPTLLWHGVDDPIVEIAGTRALAEALGCEEKALHELEGLRHETHHEHPEAVAQLFSTLRTWIEPRLLR